MSLWVICNQSGFEKLQIRCVINYSVGGTIKIFLIHNSSTAPIHHTTFAPIVDKNIIPGQFLHKIHPYFPLFKEGSVLTTDQHGTSIPIKMFLPRICHPSEDLSSIQIFFQASYPPFLNRQGESRAVLPTRQDWFQIREQRLRHC